MIGAGPASSDTDANVAQYNLIENDVVAGIGRFLPAGYPIYVLNSHNNMVTHNDVSIACPALGSLMPDFTTTHTPP